MEYLDEIDTLNNLTGNSYERNYVHQNKIGHRHVSAWILNKKGEILLQRRSYQKDHGAGLWAKTGGHVIAGETPHDALLREVKEEIGIDASNEIIDNYRVYHNKPDNTYCYHHVIILDKTIDEFTIDKEEVEELKFVTIEQLESAVSEHNKEYIFNYWDKDGFYDEMEYLRMKREELK